MSIKLYNNKSKNRKCVNCIIKNGRNHEIKKERQLVVSRNELLPENKQPCEFRGSYTYEEMLRHDLGTEK